MAVLRSATLGCCDGGGDGGVGYMARDLAGSAGRCLPHLESLQGWDMPLSSACPSLLSLPEFYDVSNHKCVRAFTFIDLDSCVNVMDYW